MILELDLGNSRGKWRIVAGGTIVARGAEAVSSWQAGDWPSVWRNVSRVRVASVLDSRVEAELASALTVLGVPIDFARATAGCAGVGNAYAEPHKLGVDRWLAMLAAFHEFQCAVLVIDAGSALTLDLVDAVGQHRGGYIIPGARLMAEALLRSTDRVRFESGAGLQATVPGVDTGACVQNGIALALVGAVRLAVEQAQEAVGVVRPVLAGGDAESLFSWFGAMDAVLRPDLVLDGLRLALP